MTKHHSLRLTGRTTGIDDVSQIIRSNGRCPPFYRMLYQSFHIDYLIFWQTLRMIAVGNDISGTGIFEDIFYTVRRIFRIARDVGGLSLQDSEKRQYQPAASRQQKSDTIPRQYSSGPQSRCDTVRKLIHFCIGKCSVASHQCFPVRCHDSIMMNTFVEKSERRFTATRCPNFIQCCSLFPADDGKRPDSFRRHLHHPLDNRNNAFSQRLPYGTTI